MSRDTQLSPAIPTQHPFIAHTRCPGRLSLDIAIPELHLAIEADGPTHVSRNSLEPLGPTLWKRRQLQRMGWRVVNIHFAHWCALDAPRVRQMELRRLMNTALPENLQIP